MREGATGAHTAVLPQPMVGGVYPRGHLKAYRTGTWEWVSSCAVGGATVGGQPSLCPRGRPLVAVVVVGLSAPRE